MDMLDRVLNYVRSVISGEVKGDPAIGRYLLDTFSTTMEGLDRGSFASSLQVCIQFIYLHFAIITEFLGHAYDLISC